MVAYTSIKRLGRCVLLLVMLVGSVGCAAGPKWDFEGRVYERRVSRAKVLPHVPNLYNYIGTLRGQVISWTDTKPASFEQQAMQKAAQKGGEAIVMLANRVSKQRLPDDQGVRREAWVRDQSWTVYRKLDLP